MFEIKYNINVGMGWRWSMYDCASVMQFDDICDITTRIQGKSTAPSTDELDAKESLNF